MAERLDAYSHTVHRNYQSFLVDGLVKLSRFGVLIDSRVGTTTELLHQTFTILRPRERFTALNSRGNNPVATIAETMWVLAGRNDMEFMTRYLPRAIDFSDDGKTWRAAYGRRLRHYGMFGVDQIQKVVDLLTKDKNSRRAVISIWDANQDWVDSKDIPCNDLLTFQVRGGRLHMTVTVRSQDIIWGSMVNMFEWSVLHEIVASHLGLDVGPVTYMVGSLHIYERHAEIANNVIKEGMRTNHPIYDVGYAATDGNLISSITGPLHTTYADIEAFMELERMSRETFDLATFITKSHDIVNPFIRDAAFAVSAFNELKRNEEMYIADWVDEMEGYDIRYAVFHYLSKIQKFMLDSKGEESQVTVKHGPDHGSDSIVKSLKDLQDAKNKVYRDSWKKHGEVLSIFSNITRKFDRMASMIDNGQYLDKATGESLFDTVGDFAVYCCLYASWLSGEPFTDQVDNAKPQAESFQKYEGYVDGSVDLMNRIATNYRTLEAALIGHDGAAPESLDKCEKIHHALEMARLAITWLVVAK